MPPGAVSMFSVKKLEVKRSKCPRKGIKIGFIFFSVKVMCGCDLELCAPPLSEFCASDSELLEEVERSVENAKKSNKISIK